MSHSRKARAKRARAQEPAPEVAPPRLLPVALALAVAGVALSAVLLRIHAGAHAGETSFCSISETVNCDRVATSGFSVVLGVPVAGWGLLGFALVGALAASGMARQRPHPGWPRGLLALLCGACAAASVALALVSKLAIGAWCLVCAGAWAVSFALLFASWRMLPAGGLGAALGSDWAAVRSRPGRSAALTGALLAVVAAAALAYPRYWERPPPAAAPAPAAAQAPAAGAPSAAESGVIVAYSDYLCPFCARAHEEERPFLAAHPELRVVKRHFPLDDACNPLVKGKMHVGACSLARAGICAEAQGRAAEMDDALYRERGRSGMEVAKELGLDMARFTECVVSPETDRRLAADISQGIRDGVRGLPSWLVGGKVYTGTLPKELFTPPPSPSTSAATAR
jgi:uncharacterized membrane protein